MADSIESYLRRDFEHFPPTVTLRMALQQLKSARERRSLPATVPFYGVLLGASGALLALLDEATLQTWRDQEKQLSDYPMPLLLTLPEVEAVNLVDIASFFREDFVQYPHIPGVVLLDNAGNPTAVLSREVIQEMNAGVPLEGLRGLESTVTPGENRDLKVPRHGLLHFPAKVPLQKRCELTITINRHKVPGEEQQIELSLDRRDWPQLVVATLVSVQPGDFLIDGPSYGLIEVHRMQDSAPLTFTLIPMSLGKKTINIRFEQLGAKKQWDYKVTTSLHTEVTATRQHQPGNAKVDHPLVFTSAAHPPDVTLYIDQVEGLHYTLSARTPGGPLDGRLPLIEEIRFPQSPVAYMQALFDDLDRKTGGGLTREEYDTQVRHIGSRLYTELFQKEGFKRFYWTELDALPEGATVQIVSDEAYIPWEILRPDRELAGRKEPDPHYFCERFALSHWSKKWSIRPDRLLLLKVIIVAPPVASQASLRFIEDEVEALQEMPGIQVMDVIRDKRKLEQFFVNGEADVVHFACHGAFKTDNPGRSRLLLGDRALEANEIVGENCNFGHARPLVFLNACESGRQGVGLTRLEGWHRRF